MRNPHTEIGAGKPHKLWIRHHRRSCFLAPHLCKWRRPNFGNICGRAFWMLSVSIKEKWWNPNLLGEFCWLESDLFTWPTLTTALFRSQCSLPKAVISMQFKDPRVFSMWLRVMIQIEWIKWKSSFIFHVPPCWPENCNHISRVCYIPSCDKHAHVSCIKSFPLALNARTFSHAEFGGNLQCQCRWLEPMWLAGIHRGAEPKPSWLRDENVMCATTERFIPSDVNGQQSTTAALLQIQGKLTMSIWCITWVIWSV